MNNKYKLGRALAVTVTALGSIAATANAAVTINVNKNGSDVQIIGTGSLNLGSARGTGSGSAGHDFNAGKSVERFYLGVFPFQDVIYPINSATSVGATATSYPVRANIGGDPTRGVFVSYDTSFNGGFLYVPAGYISNAPLDFTAFITNYDYTAYGFRAGDSTTVRWSIGEISESLTMNFDVIPEPSAAVLLGGAAVLAMARRRRKN